MQKDQPFFHILKDARLRNCQQRKGHDLACLKRLKNLKGRVSQQCSFLQYNFLLYTTQAISYIFENSYILNICCPPIKLYAEDSISIQHYYFLFKESLILNIKVKPFAAAIQF